MDNSFSAAVFNNKSHQAIIGYKPIMVIVNIQSQEIIPGITVYSNSDSNSHFKSNTSTYYKLQMELFSLGIIPHGIISQWEMTGNTFVIKLMIPVIAMIRKVK